MGKTNHGWIKLTKHTMAWTWKGTTTSSTMIYFVISCMSSIKMAKKSWDFQKGVLKIRDFGQIMSPSTYWAHNFHIYNFQMKKLKMQKCSLWQEISYDILDV